MVRINTGQTNPCASVPSVQSVFYPKNLQPMPTGNNDEA
jgi:hypothetical protein